MYAGLLRVKVPLFYISRLNHCQIFCVTYNLVCVSILHIHFCCLRVLHRFNFLSLPLLFHIQHCSLICTILFHLCHHFFFSASILFCVFVLIYCFSHWGWLNSNTGCIILASILILSKVASFHNEWYIFLCQKS